MTRISEWLDLSEMGDTPSSGWTAAGGPQGLSRAAWERQSTEEELVRILKLVIARREDRVIDLGVSYIVLADPSYRPIVHHWTDDTGAKYWDLEWPAREERP